jgi:hypothetical protein
MGFIDLHLVEYLSDSLTLVAILVELINQCKGLFRQTSQHPARVCETARLFHVFDGISLDFLILRLLFEYVDEDEILRVGANAVDDGKGELALGQVFTQAFVLRVDCVGEVLVVIADLVEEADCVAQGNAVDWDTALGLHEFDGQTE